MSGPSQELPTQSLPEAEDVSGEAVPVLIAEDPSAPRVLLPIRRSIASESAARPETGLRIESRLHSAQAEREDGLSGGGLELTELGKAVVRLDSQSVMFGPPRQDSLPVMQPRVRSASGEANLSGAWGSSQTHSHRWLFWGAAAAVLAVIGGLAIQPLLAKKNETKAGYYNQFQLVDDVVNGGDPSVYFSEHSDEVGQQMRAALTAYARARTVEEVIPLVRDGERLRDELTKHWRPWSIPANWSPPLDDSQGYASVGKLPYGIMSGSLPDFTPYSAYFVRQGDHMLVDWEASSGAGIMDMSGLAKGGQGPVVVRVMVAPVAYYTATFPESDYLAYRLSRRDSDDIAWAYVPRNSIAAETFGELFRSGAILGGSDDSPQPVRLRLARGPADSLPNQWLVLDVLHKGWVSP